MHTQTKLKTNNWKSKAWPKNCLRLHGTVSALLTLSILISFFFLYRVIITTFPTFLSATCPFRGRARTSQEANKKENLEETLRFHVYKLLQNHNKQYSQNSSFGKVILLDNKYYIFMYWEIVNIFISIKWLNASNGCAFSHQNRLSSCS